MPGQAGRGFWRNQGGTGIPWFDRLTNQVRIRTRICRENP